MNKTEELYIKNYWAIAARIFPSARQQLLLRWDVAVAHDPVGPWRGQNGRSHCTDPQQFGKNMIKNLQ